MLTNQSQQNLKSQHQQDPATKEEDSIPAKSNQYASRLENDEQEESHGVKKSDNLSAFLNFMSSMIGTGVLALPFAMYQCGYVLGFFVISALGYFSYESIKCLLEVADHRTERIRITTNSDFAQVQKAENLHYQELILEILGKRFMLFGEFCLVVYQVGACISYIIFFSQFLNEAALYSGYKVPVYLNVILTLTILIPLVLIENIHHLSNLGLYCLLSFLFSAIVLFSHAVSIFQTPTSIIYYDRLYDFSGIGSLIGVATFAFEGVGLVFHVKKSMKKRGDFNKILLFTMLFCAIVYIAFGAVGVIAYGPNLNQIVLMNIPYDGWISTFCKVGYALGKLLCIPLCVYPCYEILQKYVCPGYDFIEHHHEAEQEEEEKFHFEQKPSKFMRYFFRIGVLLAMTLIAFVIPQFSYFLNLIGGMSGLAIQFVIPSSMYIAYFYNQQNNQDCSKKIYTKIYHYIVIFSGSILSVYVTYDSLIKLI